MRAREAWQLFDPNTRNLNSRFQQLIDWPKSDAGDQMNQLLQQTALQFLVAYQYAANKTLGAYNGERYETRVAKQFA